MSESTNSEIKSSPYIDSSRSGYKVQNQELTIHKMLKQAFQDLSEDQGDLKALLPISILLDEMRSDHSSTRTYCLENLSTIALALGPVRAKGLLGGFISNLLKDQDEGVEDVPEELQVMLTLLESLPKLVNLIGGPEHSLVLLSPLLETIPDRQKDDTKYMYLKVMRQLSARIAKNHQPLLEETLNNRIMELKDGGPLEQQAVISIMSYHYNLIGEQLQMKWLDIFKLLMLSSEQAVRKRAVLSIKDFATVAVSEDDLRLCIRLAQEVFTNGKDFKSNLYTCLPSILKHPKFIPNKQHFHVLFESLITMQNNVAYNIFIEVLLDCLQSMQENKVEQKVHQLFLDQLLKLAALPELEMKQKITAVIGKLIVFIEQSKYIFKGYATQIQHYISETSNEKNFLIKYVFIISIEKNAQQKFAYNPKTSQEEIQLFIRTLCQLLLTGDLDLKFKFLMKLKNFGLILQFLQDKAFSQEECKIIMGNLITVILSLEQCKTWRMRQQCLISLYQLIQNLQQYNLLDLVDSYIPIAQTIKILLTDKISAIREESNRVLNHLFRYLRTANKGQESLAVLKLLADLIEHPNYLVRVHFILGLREAYYLGEPVLVILRKSLQDVPNVKLAMMEVLLNQQHRPKELLLVNDADCDVRDVAHKIYNL